MRHLAFTSRGYEMRSHSACRPDSGGSLGSTMASTSLFDGHATG